VLWDRAAAFGLAGALVPEDLGGGGLSLLETCLMLEGLGEGCLDSGLLFAASAHLFAGLVPLLTYGSEEQKRRWVPSLASGRVIAAHAMTETESGSDAYAMATRAERDGDHLVLNGAKAWVTNGPHADLVLVFARTGSGPPLGAVSCLVVEAGTPGLALGANEEMVGLRTAPLGTVVFEDCRVPASHVLGQEGAGALVFMTAMAWERIGILAPALGVMQRLVSASSEHAKHRKLGGRSLASRQPVAHRIVDMELRLRGARLALYEAASEVDGGRLGAGSAASKLVVADALVEVCLGALRVHGAMGLTREAGLERELRNALMSQAYSGTSEVLHDLVASSMGLR